MGNKRIICDPNNCTGCKSCINVCTHNAISIYFDKKGFWQTEINNDKCKNCGLCFKVCPILQPLQRKKHCHVYAAWAKDKAIQFHSSSGGIFYEFAKYIISKGGIVFGARWDEEYRNVFHSSAKTMVELEYLRLSKYVQSDVKYTYREVKQFLKKGTLVLFVGTPCQIAGLINYLGRKEHPALYIVDVICHGVPSPKLYNDYYNSLCDNYHSKICNVRFRCKTPIWGSNSLIIDFIDRQQYVGGNLTDPYFYLFEKKFSLRDSCYKCPFTTLNRISDITISDFWGFLPKTINDLRYDKGTSMIMINTDQGRNLYNMCKSNIYSREMTINDAIKANKSLTEPFPAPANCDDFWNDYYNHGFKFVASKYVPNNYYTFSKFKHWKNKYKFLLTFLLKYKHK